jgi:hypothetical protein
MSDPETRSKREKKMRNRNPIAKELLDRKGPFSLKVINPKKNEYRRVKLDPRDILDEEE